MGEENGVEENKQAQSRPERYYSEMLLRQYPWLKDKLEGEEYPTAFSFRKPEKLLGVSLIFIGAFVVIDTLLHPAAFGSMLPALFLLLAGGVLLYGGLWAVCFAKRSYVLVTSKRVVYQKIALTGRPGKADAVPRSEIKRVRFLKSTVMYRAGRGDGGISLELKNGATIFISSVLQGEDVFAALR